MESNVDLEFTLESIRAVASMAAHINPDDVQAVLDEISRTETIMPMVDPTGYRAIMKTIPDHKRLVRAFNAFRQEIEALKGPDHE